MVERRGFPCQRDAAGRNGKRFPGAARPELGRIDRDEWLAAATLLTLGGERGHKFPGFIRIEIAGDHDETPIGGVALFLIANEVVVADGIKPVAVTNDGMPAGIALEGAG